VQLFDADAEITPGTATYTGEIPHDRWLDFGPFVVDAGGIELSTTGTGDVDIYVSRDRIPTLLDADCHSMNADSSEYCSVEGEGVYYVAVYGYGEGSSYEMTVNYSPESVGPVTDPVVNIADDALAFSTEGTASRANDGSGLAAWYTETPVLDEEVGLDLEWSAERYVEDLVIDWVPGLDPTWVHAAIEHRGLIKDLGWFLADGRRFTIEIEDEASTIELTFENSDEERFIGIKETWAF
jgi:hypothetical protein